MAATRKAKTKRRGTNAATKRGQGQPARRRTRAPDLHPPATVRRAFARGLELKDAYGGKGLVDTTLAWARKIVDGAPVDASKAKKMRAYFARHAVDRKPGWARPPTPGYVAWLLWGGDPGRRWAERVVAQLDQS